MIALIKADGTVEERAALTFKEAQTAVGGYVEVVAFGPLPPRTWLLVNEDGLNLNLPPNELASRYASRLIVGDVVFLGGKDAYRTVMGGS